MWMVQYGKQYDSAELFDRFTTFCNNLDEINSHNSAKHTSTKGLNQFAAHSNREFKNMMGFAPQSCSMTGTCRSAANNVEVLPTSNIAASLDWTTNQVQVVTGVKDQAQCGSCWAFSATGGIEGAWALKGNSLISLSEQQLVDCSVRYGNMGCNGGLMDYAFQYVKDNGGITSEANYPYISGNGRSNYTCQSKPSVSHIASFKDVQVNSEAQLLAALQFGPVSVAIEADQLCFQLYRSGILTSASCRCGTNLDHGVLLVGYGTDATTGKDFWKVKNSWGTSWGEAGYIRFERNVVAPQGMCGIAMAASYPVV